MIPTQSNVQLSYNTNPIDGAYRHGTRAEATCNDGYYLSAGDRVRTCQGIGDSASWSGSPATCTQSEWPCCLRYLSLSTLALSAKSIPIVISAQQTEL